jgi:hypothetical protein
VGNDGTLRVRVVGDVADVQSKMSGLDKTFAGLGDSTGQAATGWSKFGDMGRGAVIGISSSLATAGIGAAMTAVSSIVDGVGNSISLASDKAEAASKVNVLFGDSARIIEAASKGAATAVGLSSGAYLTAAGDLGNLLTNFDITGDAAANMSNDMIALAADMGSFNNASTEDVTAAMGAAFRGETEPIRRFGVMLDAASVSSKAVEMGLAASTKEVSASARAQATYQLILEQTSSAQGDFARTSDGLANSQKIAAAKQEEAWTKLGDALYPLAQKIMPMLADAGTAVIGVIASIAEGIGDWIEDNQELINAVAGFVQGALGTLVDVLGDLWQLLEGPVTTALNAVGFVFGIVGKAVGILGDAIHALSDTFGDLTAPMRTTVEGLDEAKAKFNEVAAEAGLSADEIADAWTEAEAGIYDGSVRTTADAMRIINSHKEVVISAQDMVMGMGAAWGEMPAVITQSLDESVVAARVGGLAAGEAVDQAVADAVAAGKENVADDAREMMRFAGQAMELQGLDDARKLGEGIPGEIGQGMQDKANEALDAAEGLRDLLKNGLSPEERALKILGGDYVKLINKGMTSEIDGAREAAISVAAAAINTLEDAGLTGPKGEKSLEEIGKLYDTLLANGMTAAEARATLAAAGVSEATIDSLEAPAGTGANTPYDAGYDHGTYFAAGLDASKVAIRNAADRAAFAAQERLELHSPAKAGPWSQRGGPFAWMRRAGEGMGLELAAGLGRMSGVVGSAAGQLAGAADLQGLASVQLPGIGGTQSLVGMPGANASASIAAPNTTVHVGGVTIQIYDARDPEKVANTVRDKLRDLLLGAPALSLDTSGRPL